MFLLFRICKLFLLFLELRKYAIGTVEKIEIYLGFKKDYKSKYYSRSPFFYSDTDAASKALYTIHQIMGGVHEIT